MPRRPCPSAPLRLREPAGRALLRELRRPTGPDGSEAPILEERKVASVLFADLVGFAGRGDPPFE